ncbi:MAG: hypothetical protein Q8R92_02700, partial [Deltaproteobacteria bacterium]|nr:hypothetical protein [Deltaproteobacteria bacterium]
MPESMNAIYPIVAITIGSKDGTQKLTPRVRWPSTSRISVLPESSYSTESLGLRPFYEEAEFALLTLEERQCRALYPPTK